MSQADRIKFLFKSNPEEWIPCFELIKYSLQYNARIYELRQEGMFIENKTQQVEGQKRSWYRYIPDTQGRLF